MLKTNKVKGFPDRCEIIEEEYSVQQQEMYASEDIFADIKDIILNRKLETYTDNPKAHLDMLSEQFKTRCVNSLFYNSCSNG